eukprot:SM000132S26894  [mRNA]  locus=s132:235812:238836:- [translate_table: standard]
MEGSDASAEEKLRLLYARFQKQLVEMRQLEADLGALRRRCEHAQRDRDLAVAESAKGAAVRQKLESLCRELQRQNKAVIVSPSPFLRGLAVMTDESKRVALDEQHKRQELSAKFHATIKVKESLNTPLGCHPPPSSLPPLSLLLTPLPAEALPTSSPAGLLVQDITSKLEDQSDERIRQIRENETLKDKLKHFRQQYEIREQHFAHQLRTKVLEQQLLEAKLKQQQDVAAQGDAKVAPGPLFICARLLLSPADRAAASYALRLGGGDQAQMYLEQINQLLKTEAELRSQLAMYGDKFEQFQPHVTLAAAATQDTLTKSNEVFSTFKKEMEKMSKTIKKLEKENGSLKAKCEKSDVSIIELLDERSATKKQLETVRTQKERLEALCRSLQLERKLAASAAAATPSPGAAVSLPQAPVAPSTPSTPGGADAG